MTKNKFIVFGLITYVFTTCLSYIVFANVATSKKLSNPTPGTSNAVKGNDYDAVVFDTKAPKTQECPLNGAMYSKEQEKWWKDHRPLGVMIENHLEARPQSGISFADVTYESVAEGGITRTLNVYYCQDAGIVGPVRSARTYFLDYISEYGQYPLYAHVGGANTPGPANALGQIGEYGWNQYNDLNQFSIGFPTFRRDESRLGRQVATEHTMYSTTSLLWKVGEKRGLTDKDKEGASWDEGFVKYSFKEDAPAAERPASQAVHIDFWNGDDYSVDWKFDPKQNLYLRDNGGVPHTDRNTKNQLSARNVVVLFMKESHANDGYENNAHMLYGTIGSGQALVFQDGKKITAKWKKADREARTILTDASGKEIKFNRGKIWFEIQPIGADVTVN